MFDRPGGQVTEVTVTGERGRPCRIAKAWPGETSVAGSTGRPVPCETEDDILTFPAAPDRTYQLRRKQPN